MHARAEVGGFRSGLWIVRLVAIPVSATALVLCASHLAHWGGIGVELLTTAETPRDVARPMLEVAVRLIGFSLITMGALVFGFVLVTGTRRSWPELRRAVLAQVAGLSLPVGAFAILRSLGLPVPSVGLVDLDRTLSAAVGSAVALLVAARPVLPVPRQTPEPGSRLVSPRTSVPEPVPPGRRYRLTTRVGGDEFNGVWSAVDEAHNRRVLVWVTRLADQVEINRVRAEARALAMVRHPHCVRIRDVHTDVDGVWMITDRLSGAALDEVVTPGALMDDEAAARLWLALAAALETAHTHGVLHGDLRPGNVMIDSTGDPLLIGFGLGRVVMAAPGYRPREIPPGGLPTRAADAWQLAAVIVFALSAAPPFARPTRSGGITLHGRPRRSAHHDLLRSALAPDPADRPSLGRVRRQLTAWLNGQAASQGVEARSVETGR